LRYYLRSRYPDLLIIFPPFNHEKCAETNSSLANRLQYFLSLMDLYLPNDVEVRGHSIIMCNAGLNIT